MTVPSTGRSKAKSSLPQIDVAAKEYVSSNSTSAMFLGGQQKSWMTGPKEIGISPRRAPLKTNIGRKPGMLRERSVNQPPSLNTTTDNLNLNHTTTSPRHPTGNQPTPPADRCLDRVTSHGPPSEKTSADAGQNVETVLPSPAPSDEHRSDNIQNNGSDIDGQILSVEGNSVPTSSDIPARSTHDLEETEIDRMLRYAIESDLAVSQTQQVPIQFTNTTAGRHMPNQGPSERKRKRNDIGVAATESGTRSNHTTTNTENFSNHKTSSANRQGHIEIDMNRLQQMITDRIEQRAVINASGDAEAARLNLLQRACIQHDYVYLLLHQIYCMDLTLPSVTKQLGELGFQHGHINGLGMMVPLLLPNLQCLASDSICWFAHFPSPIRAMLDKCQIYHKALESVKTCLAAFSFSWPKYRAHCNKRSYPPLVGELIEILRIDSSVLQSVVFRAVLKDMWTWNTDDSCFQVGEGLFQQNQHLLQQVRSPIDRQRDDQHLVTKYQQLHAAHANHRRHSGSNASTSTMVHSPLTTDPLTPGSTPFQQSPRIAQGVLAGSQNSSVTRQSFDQRRVRPPHNINTQIRQSPAFPSRITPTLPSQPLLPSQLSPSPHPGNSGAYPISPPIPISTAGWQASQALRSSNNRPLNVTSPNLVTSPQTFVGLNQSPAIRTGSWPSPTTTHAAPHPMPQTQVSTVAPNPRPLDRTLLMQHSGWSPHGAHPQSLVPPVGQRLSTTAHPNPMVAALHQSQTQSPILTIVDDYGRLVMSTKYFRYVEGVSVLDSRLKIGRRQHTEFNFYIGEDDAALLSGTRENQKGAPFIRHVKLGSRFGRVRCIDATKFTDLQADNQRAWVTATQIWPEHVTVIFNGKHLDVRKKAHYGKDLPIDVTAAIKFGNNQFSVSILTPQTEDQIEYAVGLETIQLVDAAEAKALTGVLAYDEARQRVLRRLQNDDPDIEVVNSYVVINMSDPYTFRIWNVPMRGKYCLHDQCFDLDTFLETRTSKRSGQPCDPDQFKCPVCGGDARPQSLVKDEFFEVLRAELAQRNRLDAKAIVMQQDGTWEVQEEEKTGEAGDGSGRRLRARAESAASTMTKDSNSTMGPIEVIELD